MRITRIEFEGQIGYFATAHRKRYTDHIEVELLTPDFPNGKQYQIAANSEEDIYAMAEQMQLSLEGYRGTNSDIHDYYRELIRLGKF
ncbi:hypothetical protein STSP2_01085 [Anaerohalosphaera lusitana]|uniref:Uncharacterized protein n=1 Tax=Anaerohalosphaera lusitana TaxID=1936003 RepID=A0A1U9NJ23_9BACT|nr:hypothetical protein [Anaerohalosphaera lusitana]AQT67933.1 hypothetical protein STSP2_01085 [Anaerohalosphaera lusitana]